MKRIICVFVRMEVSATIFEIPSEDILKIHVFNLCIVRASMCRFNLYMPFRTLCIFICFIFEICLTDGIRVRPHPSQYWFFERMLNSTTHFKNFISFISKGKIYILLSIFESVRGSTKNRYVTFSRPTFLPKLNWKLARNQRYRNKQPTQSRSRTEAQQEQEEESIERHIWQVDVTQRFRGRKLLCKVGSPELPDSLSEKFPYFISSFSLFLCIFTALEIHRFFLASTASDLRNSGPRSWW